MLSSSSSSPACVMTRHDSSYIARLSTSLPPPEQTVNKAPSCSDMCYLVEQSKLSVCWLSQSWTLSFPNGLQIYLRGIAGGSVHTSCLLKTDHCWQKHDRRTEKAQMPLTLVIPADVMLQAQNCQGHSHSDKQARSQKAAGSARSKTDKSWYRQIGTAVFNRAVLGWCLTGASSCAANLSWLHDFPLPVIADCAAAVKINLQHRQLQLRPISS